MPPPWKVLTATHDGGEKPKRFGFKAPTFDGWLEMYLQDDMPEQIVGVLLNLNSDEVTDLKSCIRHELRFRTVTVSTFDVWYPPTGPKTELLCKKGQAQLGWHLSPSKTTSLIRSSTVFAVALEFPHLFKEPTTLEDFRKEWTDAQHLRLLFCGALPVPPRYPGSYGRHLWRGNGERQEPACWRYRPKALQEEALHDPREYEHPDLEQESPHRCSSD